MPSCRNLSAAKGREHGDHITQIQQGSNPATRAINIRKDEKVGGDLNDANPTDVEATCRKIQESSSHIKFKGAKVSTE